MNRLARLSRMFLLTVALSSNVLIGNAADRYSVASGNWSDTTTWAASRGGAPGASVPTALDDVYIDDGYEVSVDIYGSCNNLFVGQGGSAILNIGRRTTQPTSQSLTLSGSVTVNAGASIIPRRNTEVHSFVVAGDITNHGTFNFTSNTANGPVCNVTFNTAGNHTVGGTRGVSFHNLTIVAGSVVSLVSDGHVIGGVLLCNGTLNTGGFLTLRSFAVRTALVDGSGTGSIVGSVTMQRYLPSGFGYKYFSSPFAAATVGEFSEEMNLAAAFPLFYRYDESLSTSGWLVYTTASNILNSLEGYAINFGDVPVPKTVNVRGEINSGSISRTLINNNNSFTKGYNLVGNPYPSPINWNAAGWTKTNIDNAVWYFRASTTDQYGGAYSSYVNGVSSDGVASNIIPSMQGFFVHVTDGAYPVTGALGVTNSVRVNNFSQTFLKSSEALTRFLVRVTASFAGDTSSVDPLVVYFEENAGPYFESELDALKLMNTDLLVTNFYSFESGGRKLSINALPVQTDTAMLVPLGLKIYIDGEISFTIRDIENLPEGANIYFRDRLTGASINLLDGKSYKVSLGAGSYDDRFYLAFLKSVTAIIDQESPPGIIKTWCSGRLLRATVNEMEAGSGTIAILDHSGRRLFSTRVYETGFYEFETGLQPGIYIVIYETGKRSVATKLILGF